MKALLGPLACALLVLAAGCLEGGGPAPATGDPVGSPGGGARLGRPPSNETTTDGIVLTANASAAGFGAGQNLTVAFHARNDGGAVLVNGGPCDDPWRLHVYDANGMEVPASLPTPRCRAATLPTPFPTGAESWHNFTWDGRLYENGIDGAPAAPGEYRIEATFGATRAATTFEARVSVTVLVLADPTVV